MEEKLKMLELENNLRQEENRKRGMLMHDEKVKGRRSSKRLDSGLAPKKHKSYKTNGNNNLLEMFG